MVIVVHFIYFILFLIFVIFQASTYASMDGILTEEILDARVQEMIKQHKQKVDWLKDDSESNKSYMNPDLHYS